MKCISSLAVLLLLAKSSSASFNKVGQGVVRVDLEKRFMPKVEAMELTEELDNIYIEDESYVMLRQKQSKMINKSIH